MTQSRKQLPELSSTLNIPVQIVLETGSLEITFKQMPVKKLLPLAQCIKN